MGEGVEYFEIEGRSVTEVTERARRLAIAYALLLNALEHTYPDPDLDCSYAPNLDYSCALDWRRITGFRVIGFAAVLFFGMFVVLFMMMSGQ
jgi:hypothetical protein